MRTGLARASSEASSAFGDDRVLIEKFIVDPRHIEIQVLGDKHGNIIHLGERECSIQRRNQKVVEEAPSPLLDEKTRRQMGEQAVALAKAVGYDSAGTVEFVVGQDKSFYFLEMNTRLQVEHPVTELVTGIDLVEQMIRDCGRREARARAERREDCGLGGRDPHLRRRPRAQFPPVDRTTGRYRSPPEGRTGAITIRTDTGVTEGGEISLYYDPLIAKLITHAPSRRAAIDAQADALDGFTIEGVRHNISFLSALMQHERWQNGNLSTAFLPEEFPQGFRSRAPSEETARAWRRSPPASTMCGRAQAPHLRPNPGPAVTRERRRTVRLGEREIALDIARAAPCRFGAVRSRTGTSTGPPNRVLAVRFVDGRSHDRHVLVSTWRPGDAVWMGSDRWARDIGAGHPCAQRIRSVASRH